MPKVLVGNFKGPKGDKGDKGDKGEQGIQGVKGNTGAQGRHTKIRELGHQGRHISVIAHRSIQWPIVAQCMGV